MRSPLALRLALRELRGGLRGFAVFLACLALGVGAIAAVGTTARGLTDGLAREGRAILGGDIAFGLVHREANPAERAFFESLGRVSAAASVRAMVRTPDRADQTLAEVKAVDGAYPLAGTLVLDPPMSAEAAFAPRGGVHGAAVEEALATRLGLAVGGRLVLGGSELELRAILRSEPDKLSGGVGFGPRLLTSTAALAASGLVQPGGLLRWTYRVALDQASDARLESIAAAVPVRFPEAGFEIRTRRNATPQLQRNVERFTQFLALVGLTALIVGGVGVANAVSAHVEARRATIATLKALGATGGTVVAVYLVETGLIAALGIAIGLALGAALPFALEALLAHLLPLPLALGLQPGELLLAAAYGLLIALAFALWPLGRAHDVPVQALYRDQVAGKARRPRAIYVAALAATAAALVALALAVAADQRVAWMYALAAGGAFLTLRLVASGIMALAKRSPRPRGAELRLALTNIHRPGALTPTVVLSLGLGLTLLVALALVDGNLRRQIATTLPERAPSFYFIDVPSGEIDAFADLVRREAPAARLATVPILRGRIAALRGTPAEAYPVPPQAAWVLAGDRGLTYSARLPENARLAEGSWWAEDHSGAPLVSFEERLARQLNLAVGDRITVNVLGRNLEVTVANLRVVQWETLGINFVMVFSPNTFRGAPHTHLATLTYPGGGTTAEEVALLRRVTDAFPAVATIRVKEALEAVNGLVAQLAVAVRGAASLTLVASILVLAGALAAGHAGRIYDAVILKTLGATRARLVAAYALEYLILGVATALFACIVGTVAAWAVLTRVMDVPFAPLPEVAIGAAAAALAVTVALGLAGTWRILAQRPAPVLRTL